MKKRTVLALIVVAIMVVSATIVLSYQGMRGNRIQNWDKEKLLTLEGKVTDADRPIITMEANGKEYTLHLGPAMFWQDKGYAIEKGKDIKVTGMVEEVNGKLNIYPQTINMDGKEITLSDENGVPVWAGQQQSYRYGRMAANNGWQGRGRYGRHGMGNCRGYAGRGNGYCGTCGW